MPMRINEVLKSESINTAATKTIDIKTSEPISSFVIRAKGTNSSSTPTAHPAKMIKKIEVVDGSDVLFAMSGVQCQALNFQEKPELNFSIAEYENDIQCAATYNINFGRWLWDEALALDPKRFNNLQLKITHDKALGGSAPDAGTMAIFAHMFEDANIAPRGFLMSKEHFAYTLTASAWKEIELPTDWPYRFVIPQSYVDEKVYTDQINTLKFTLDWDKRILINEISVSELLKVWPILDKVEEDFAGLGTGSAVDYFVASTYENYGIGVGRSAHQSAMIVSQPAGNRIEVTNDSSESFACRATGYAPFGSLNIMLQKKMEIEKWFNPRPWQSVRLNIKAGGSGSGINSVLLQQFRSY